ncbi:MAG TPA: hypothetical protein VLI54_03755 [Bacillota bacterium]|nr:hypothetical protein [Bacillota bacterium]
MHDRRFTKLLLLPSLSSGTIVCLLGLIILGYSGWLFIRENQLFYNYLFGAYGLETFAWQTNVAGSIWNQRFLSSPLAYYALVGAAATAVGITIYALLQGIPLLFGRTRWLVGSVRATGSRHNEALEQLARLVLRIISLGGWGLFTAFFVSTVVPFCVVLTQFGIGNLQGDRPFGWVQLVTALVLFIASLHLHVVFMRLCLLRPRVFGGASAIEEAEAHSL